MKKKLLSVVLVICTFSFLITIVGCTKTIELVKGTYTASDITMTESMTIDYLQLDIHEQENADDEIISICLSYNGGEILQTVSGLTYYTKELKIAFEFDEKVGYIMAKTKQKGDEVFIDGTLTIDTVGIDIKLIKTA